jgi:hypothetical protein
VDEEAVVEEDFDVEDEALDDDLDVDDEIVEVEDFEVEVEETEDVADVDAVAVGDGAVPLASP